MNLISHQRGTTPIVGVSEQGAEGNILTSKTGRGQWRKLYNFYFSHNNLQVIK
jgi:hypothetical protein